MYNASAFWEHFTFKMAWISWRHTVATKKAHQAKLAEGLVRWRRRRLRSCWRRWQQHILDSARMLQVSRSRSREMHSRLLFCIHAMPCSH